MLVQRICAGHCGISSGTMPLIVSKLNLSAMFREGDCSMTAVFVTGMCGFMLHMVMVLAMDVWIVAQLPG